MTTTTKIWTHGCGLMTDDKPTVTTLDRRGDGTRVSAVQVSSPHTVSIAIPSPSLLSGKPVHATAILLKYRTNDAQINQITVSDGVINVVPPYVGPFTSTNPISVHAFSMSPVHPVQGGMALTIELAFLNAGGFIDLVGAGIEFQA
jgi:hypothetical protein